LYAEWSRDEPVRDSRFAGVDGTRLYDITYIAGAVRSASRLVLPRGAGEIRRRAIGDADGTVRADSISGPATGTVARSALAPESKKTGTAGDTLATTGSNNTAGGSKGRANRAAAVLATAGAGPGAQSSTGQEYVYYPNPSFGTRHFNNRHATNCQVPLLLLPSLLFAAAVGLDFAAFATQYGDSVCRMTNPQTRSCFNQPDTCCKGEIIDTVPYAALSMAVLALSIIACLVQLWQSLDLTIASPVLRVLHPLGLAPVYHAVKLIMAIMSTAPVPAATPALGAGGPPAAPGANRPRGLSIGMGKAARAKAKSFKEENPMGDAPDLAVTGAADAKPALRAARPSIASGVTLAAEMKMEPMASSTDPNVLLFTGAPWLFSGVSRAQLSRVVLHAVPALLLHGYGLYALWTFEEPPTLVLLAPILTLVVLWWYLVAADVGGLSTKSLRFLRPPRDTPLWKDPKMPSLFVRAVADGLDPVWLGVVCLLSAVYRAMELLSRVLILGGVLGATRGVLLAVLLPAWMVTYYIYAAWSYPRERDLVKRGEYIAWAQPEWPGVQEQQQAEAAAAAINQAGGASTPSSTSSPGRSSSKVKAPQVPESGGGLKGGGRNAASATAGPSRLAAPPTSPVGGGDSKFTALSSVRAGSNAAGVNGGSKDTPTVKTAITPSGVPAGLRCRHFWQACGVRCGDCCRPLVRDTVVWWGERGIAPWDSRFLLSLLAFPAPNWSPLFPTLGSVGAPLTANYPVWSFYASRAVEDICGLLLYAALQRYGENVLHDELNAGPIGPLPRVWCCMDTLWLLLVSSTLVKYILLPVYLNLFQMLAQPPLEDEEGDGSSIMSMAWWRRVNPNKVPDWATEPAPGQPGHKPGHRPSAIERQVISPAEQAELRAETGDEKV